MAMTGGCACSAIKYELPEYTGFNVCHCGTCRAWTGGVYMSVEAGKNPIISDPGNNLKVWKSSDAVERAFCQICGSSLYCKLTTPGPHFGNYYICAGGVDDWKDMKLRRELFIDYKPNGYCLAPPDSNHTKLTKAEYLASPH